MTMTDMVLNDQNRKHTFSNYILISCLSALSVPVAVCEMPQPHNFISYEQIHNTSGSYGTLEVEVEVEETFISDENILEALIAFHENLMESQLILDGDLSHLLYTDIEELYA